MLNMKTLFVTGPVYDKHIVSIISIMLKMLRNNKPRPDSKCYIVTANYLTELYNGTFLYHQFDLSRSNQYDMNGWMDKIRSCKGNWNNIRCLVVNSIKNIELAKEPNRLPFSKKYVNGITFASFFEGPYSYNGLISCNFINFINEPKMCYNHSIDTKIENVKKDVLDSIKRPAEIFANKYFTVKRQQLSFWYSMKDWSRWMRLFKRTFPSIYGEFISSCEEGNMFIDFKNYLINILTIKQGESFIMEETNFQLSRRDSDKLEGYIRTWFRARIESGAFSVLKNLPKYIDSYYTDESFSIELDSEESVQQKPVLELTDIIF